VMSLGLCLSRIVDGIRWAGERIGGSAKRAGGLAATAGVPAVIVLVAALLLPGNITYAKTFVSSAYDPEAAVVSQIPKGACVVFDEAGILIDSNRLLPSQSGCPDLVDAFGLWLTDNNGVPPPAQPQSEAFVAKWLSWLEKADYLVLSVPQSDYLPWTPSLLSWFSANYHLVASQPHVYVYKRTAQAADLVTQGLKAQLSGDLTTAENDYREAVQLDQNNTLAHYDLGTIYDQQGKQAEAVREYQVTLTVDPNFAQALFNLGVDTANSDPQGAEVLYRKVVSLQPNWATAWLNLGFALQSEGKVAEAKADWAKAISIDPSLASRIPSSGPG
jgi:Flp pilus assembly protein TadD